MKTLHIIHPEFDFSAVDPNSRLLTSIDEPLPSNVYHTSLGDLSANNICQISEQFDVIKFVDRCFDYQSDLFKETAVLLNFLSHGHNVEGFVARSPIQVVDVDIDVSTRAHTPTLWIFGCSMSHGVGLDDPAQRYGQLLSTAYKMPVRFITNPGSSTAWSLRHLVNANILPNDIVVWQLTTPHRVTLITDNTPREYLLKEVKDKYVVASLSEDQIVYNQLLLVNQGVQYLRALRVKFAVISILNNVPRFYDYLLGYTSYKEYCYIPNQELDIGNDGIHSGPLTHQNVAAQLITHLSCS